MRAFIIAFSASILISPSVAAESRGEPFVAVTAMTGRDWVEQCDQPAYKSDSAVRVGACISFLKGAREIAMAQPDRFCLANLADTIPGALLDVSFYIERKKPEIAVSELVLLTLRGVAPLPCRPNA